MGNFSFIENIVGEGGIMKQDFSPLQEKEISLGFKHGLEKHEVQVYAKEKFNYLQMREIRLGFEYGLSKKEVKKYAKKYIPFEKMKEVREQIQLGDRASVPNLMPGGIDRGIYIYGIVVGIILLLSLFYLGKTIFHKPIVLELVDDWIELDGSTPFTPSLYVKEYTEENTQLHLPRTIDFKVPGNRVVLYELVGKDETIQKLLRIKIVDDEEPTLTLSDHKVYLEDGESFDCRAYILEAYDEINGDLRNRVECDSTLMEDVSKQEVLYRVKDSAGNVVEDSLTVEIITSPKNT